MTLSLFYEEQAFPTLLICLNLRAALLTLPPVTTPLRVALFKC